MNDGFLMVSNEMAVVYRGERSGLWDYTQSASPFPSTPCSHTVSDPLITIRLNLARDNR